MIQLESETQQIPSKTASDSVRNPVQKSPVHGSTRGSHLVWDFALQLRKRKCFLWQELPGCTHTQARRHVWRGRANVQAWRMRCCACMRYSLPALRALCAFVIVSKKVGSNGIHVFGGAPVEGALPRGLAMSALTQTPAAPRVIF